jgi:23S rRNA (uridine2552-2'-O)-methyltransferase
MLQGDFTKPAVQERLIEELGGKADLVLSDMAPNTTGHGATDHLRILALAEAALAFALDVLADGGGFVAKVFQGGAEKTMLDRLKRLFRRAACQAAGEPGVERIFMVATGFRITRE